MKIAVRYYSRGGNTKKLADAIAKAVGVEALTADTPLKEDRRRSPDRRYSSQGGC